MKRIAVHVEDDVFDAVERTARMERRSRSALCAGIIEAVLTDGGTIRIEDVAAADRGRERGDEEPEPRAGGKHTSPTPSRGSGVVGRVMDRRQT